MIQLKENIIFAGRYKLVKQLGVGGFSEVWLAKDQMTGGTKVAVKIYVPDKGLDDIGITQFSKEYALTEPLNHTNLLKSSHFDIVNGSPFLKMPYIANGSLNRKLFEKGNFKENEIAEIILQISDALAYLHKQNPPILHQDIKPDNVLIDREGKYLLTDFGISSRMRSTLQKSTTNKGTMTVAYAPPEKFGRVPQNLIEGDIFSLGVMIYEIATGDVPWMGAGGVVLSNENQIPFVLENCSTELAILIVACMQIKAQNRPSAKELFDVASNFIKTNKWDIGFLKDKIDINFYKKEIEKDKNLYKNPENKDSKFLSGNIKSKKNDSDYKPESKRIARETVKKQPSIKTSDKSLKQKMKIYEELFDVFYEDQNISDKERKQLITKQNELKLSDDEVNKIENHICEQFKNRNEHRKVKKQRLKILGFIFFLILVIGTTYYFMIPRENDIYLKTASINTVKAYNDFLRIYPSGKYARMAYKEIDRIEYNFALTDNTKESYQLYLSKQPKGEYINDAKDKIQEIELFNELLVVYDSNIVLGNSYFTKGEGYYKEALGYYYKALHTSIDNEGAQSYINMVEIEIDKLVTKYTNALNDIRKYFGDCDAAAIEYYNKILQLNEDIQIRDLLNKCTTVFYDDFSDDRNNWLWKSDSINIYTSSGKLILENTYYGSIYPARKKILLDYSKDYLIETDIRLNAIDNDASAYFYVLFGQNDWDNYITFRIDQTGYAWIFKEEDGKITTIKSERPNYLNKGSVTNEIKISKIGNILKFYINEILFCETYAIDFYGEYIGVASGPRTKCEVYYLRVMGFKK